MIVPKAGKCDRSVPGRREEIEETTESVLLLLEVFTSKSLATMKSLNIAIFIHFLRLFSKIVVRQIKSVMLKYHPPFRIT